MVPGLPVVPQRSEVTRPPGIPRATAPVIPGPPVVPSSPSLGLPEVRDVDKGEFPRDQVHFQFP
jgi:hypothetical protein